MIILQIYTFIADQTVILVAVIFQRKTLWRHMITVRQKAELT